MIEIHLEIDGLAALDDVSELSVRAGLNRAAVALGAYGKQVWSAMTHEVGAIDQQDYLKGITENGRVEVKRPALMQESGSSHVEIVVEVTNTAKHASIVEEGHGAYSLPDKIDRRQGTGSIKVSSDGKPYLHIPFRHYTPKDARGGATRTALRGLMPRGVYRQAVRLMWHTRLNNGAVRRPYAPPGHGHQFTTRHPDGQFVQADRYVFDAHGRKTYTKHRLFERGEVSTGFRLDPHSGQLVEERRSSRLVGRDASGRPLRNPEWQNSKFEGMMKTGAPGHSRYMTIRTITPDSEGWRIPAQPGYFVAAKTARAISGAPEAARLFEQAVAATLFGDGHATPTAGRPA